MLGNCVLGSLSVLIAAILLLSNAVLGVVNPCAYVPSFTLVDASTRRDIGKLRSTIRIQDYPANTTFNIRVNVNDTACEQRIQSVLINYNESTNDGLVFQRTFCEEYLPYTVFGDYNPSSTDVSNYARARYFRHVFPNVSATAWLQAVPYFGAGCQGRVHGQGRKRRFVVENAVFKAFESTEELYDAVDAWLAGDNVSDSMLAATYGYPIGAWDVSRITNFNSVFSGWSFCILHVPYQCGPPGRNENASHFQDDISMWNVSSAKSMSYMFYYSSFHGDLSQWDVSGVTDMSYMFSYSSYNGDLSTWDVSRVTNMNGMFARSSFDGHISAWDVSNVRDMSKMFQWATLFNTDISAWNVSNVLNMNDMFNSASAFNQDLCVWGNRLPPDADVGEAFYDTACPVTDFVTDLKASPPGPFCHECV